MEVRQGMKHPFDGLSGGANDENGGPVMMIITTNPMRKYLQRPESLHKKRTWRKNLLLNKTSSSCLM